MNGRTQQLGFYLILLVGAAILFYLVAAPFVSAIFLAIITAVLFRPLNDRILQSLRGRKTLGAFVCTVVVLFVISAPLFLVGHLLVKESASFYVGSQNSQVGGAALGLSVSKLEAFVEARLPGLNVNFARFLNIGPYADQALAWLSGHLVSFFSQFLRITISAFIYVLCVFYLFRDGRNLLKKVLAWSPLFDIYDNLILSKLSVAVSSVIRGQLMIGLIQGFLTGLGFWIFGVPNPVIWGTVAAVASLVPAIGTSLVNGPAVLYLLMIGNPFMAVGLAVWATLAVGLVDNMVGPYLINRSVAIHPFLILISVLGGLTFFGPVGFIAGPVVLSLLSALLDLYPTIMHKEGAKS